MRARRLPGGAALFSCIALFVCATLAHAQAGQPVFAPSNLSAAGVRDLAATCAPCHGPEGRGPAGSGAASLAARRDIGARLRELRGNLTAESVMPQIARGLADAEIDALSAYFAAKEQRK